MEQLADPVFAMTDREAFGDAVRPHWPAMAALARRLAPSGDGDDVLQDALCDAWRKRDQFDASRGSARNWLLAIVADQARKGRRRLRPTSELTDVSVEESAGEADLDLRAALGRLTIRQRTVVALYYYLRLPVAEIADIVGCSVGTVKSTLSDSRARLRELLGEDYIR